MKRFVAVLAGALGFANAAAQDSWQFALTPYVWLPNVNANMNFSLPPGAGGRLGVEVGPNDYLENLDMVLMLSGEARRGDWAVLADFIWLDFSKEKAAVGGAASTATQASLEGLVWQLAASHAISRSDKATVEVLGGFRYLAIETRVDFPPPASHSEKEELWDAIVGARGRLRLGEGNWFVPWYLDIGAGSSELTWQAMAGIGFAFKWGEALLAYRHLSYDQGEGKLIQDMSFSGPALAASFRF